MIFFLEIKFLHGNIISMSKANFFMWRYFLPVKESSLYEISSCVQKISSCTGNFFWKAPGTGNFLLWQEISFFYKKSSCGQKFLTVARNFFLWQNISCWGKYMFVIAREFLPTFRVSLKILWEPGSLAPGEYPTLAPSLKATLFCRLDKATKQCQSDVLLSLCYCWNYMHP